MEGLTALLFWRPESSLGLPGTSDFAHLEQTEWVSLRLSRLPEVGYDRIALPKSSSRRAGFICAKTQARKALN